jgi:hypothetical protein
MTPPSRAAATARDRKVATKRTADVAKRADLLPHADTTDRVDAPDPDGNPTGMFAGETDRDRTREDAGREVLEDALPGEPGSWKESGAVPDHAPEES